jgi:hypothetical protein
MVSKGVTAHTRFAACLEWRGDVVAGHRSSRCGSNGRQKAQLSGALGEERREERDPREKRTCCEGVVAWGTRTRREQVATALQWRRGSSEAQSKGVGGRERTCAQRTAMSVWARPVGRLLLGPA